MPELVTGATGYIGGRLIDRLLRDGREVRALARNPSKLEAPPEVKAVKGDLVTGRGLKRALDGVSTAYYLVHSMEPSAGAGGDFASRDRSAAENFAGAAEAAGVERIVYLGGMVPSTDNGVLSPHLASRLEVERTLLEALPRSTALRASIVVGARSSSFRILVRLVERLRVLPFPAWRDHRTQPIDERDAIAYLAHTPFTPGAAGKSLDIAGPDLMSYAQMIERIAGLMGVGRTPLRLRASATPLASAVVGAIVDQPVELVRPLMYSLERDLLPRNDSARELYGFRIHSFDRAVEHALREWEGREELAAR
jgi:uncharacterized protein YbjT (DUF2867 family)